MGRDRTAKLANGIKMPMLGLGTWTMDDAEAENVVGYALKEGYRHIDTAKLYGNEAGVGRAVTNSGIPRSEIFITTKLWPTDFFNAEAAFHRSLERLGLEYVDLYLIHWPIPLMPATLWKTMEKIYKDELARAVGVSNYGISEIEAVLESAKIPPMVNQVKCSPWDFNKELFDYCREKNIAFEAYSPLTRRSHLGDEVLAEIAAKHGRTPAQILLRWNIEHGMVTIPKSSNPERLKENLAIFDFSLGEEDMATLDNLS